MKYEKLDKSGWLDGRMALEIIGIDQMSSEDDFIVFYNDTGDRIAVESVVTLKSIYGISAESWEDVAKAYAEVLMNTEDLPTPEERIAALQAQNDVVSQTLDTILTEILPMMMGI